MVRTSALWILACILALVPLGCVSRPMPTSDPLNEDKPRTPIRVVEVVDLRHLKLEDGRIVELHGIVPPESDHATSLEGSDYLRRLVEGKAVIIDGDQDNWYANSWHANVFVPAAPYPIYVNGEMVRKGYAYAFTTPPNDRWESWLSEQQFEAREEHLGVWKDRPAGSEYYVTDSYSNYFHRNDCEFAGKLQFADHYGMRGDAVADHKVPCPDCDP